MIAIFKDKETEIQGGAIIFHGNKVTGQDENLKNPGLLC